MVCSFGHPKEKNNGDDAAGKLLTRKYEADFQFRKLTAAQTQAIDHIRAMAGSVQSRANKTMEEILACECTQQIDSKALISNIFAHARVTMNFHPDRVLPDGFTVIEGLLSEGKYQSQFKTGVTNGSPTAHPGGQRDRWEQKLFGGAYHTPGVQDEKRPKYGALNIMNHEDGAAPRFGSCYLRLYPHVSNRCTFTFGDSHTEPECIGTSDVFEPLLSALFEAVEATQAALGSPNQNISSIVSWILKLHTVDHDHLTGIPGRSLDDYIEAQVHGDIDLYTDVEALVADPSFKGTQIGDQLEALCSKYGMNLLWHSGFRLATQSVPEDFRGPAMPPLARRIDHSFTLTPGYIDAAAIGRAAAALHYRPEIWKDWGTPKETFQHLKQLWHVLVRFGQPMKEFP